MKKCTSCQRFLHHSEFRFKNKTEKTLQPQCKECCRAAGKKHYRANRYQQIKKQTARNANNRKELVSFKKILNCQCCGETEWYCLDFHHVDPKHKDFNFGSQTHAWSKIRRELSKCVCVCACCHRKIHYGTLSLPSDRQYLAQKEADWSSHKYCL